MIAKLSLIAPLCRHAFGGIAPLRVVPHRGFHPKGGAGETGVVRDKCEGGEGGEVRRVRRNRVDNYGESVPMLVLCGYSN